MLMLNLNPSSVYSLQNRHRPRSNIQFIFMNKVLYLMYRTELCSSTARLWGHLSWQSQGSAAPCAVRLQPDVPCPAGVCVHWAPVEWSSHYPDTRLLCKAQQTWGRNRIKKDRHHNRIVIAFIYSYKTILSPKKHLKVRLKLMQLY